MAERILAILILCAATAAPFCLVWTAARDLGMEMALYPPRQPGARCVPDSADGIIGPDTDTVVSVNVIQRVESRARARLELCASLIDAR